MTDDEYLNRKGEVWVVTINGDGVHKSTDLNNSTVPLAHKLRLLDKYREDYFLTKEEAEAEAELRRIQCKLKGYL